MHGDTTINCQTDVELVDEDFLRVIDIIRNTRTLEIVLRGWRFRRNEKMNGLFEKKSNEICWIIQVDEDDKREPSVRAMESRPITDVRKRRLIRMTNRPFPELSWREDSEADKEVIYSDLVLVCRYKQVCTYADANARRRDQWCEMALYRLTQEECDPLIGMKDEALRYAWRGETVKGGSWKEFAAEEAEFMPQEGQCAQTAQFPQIASTNICFRLAEDRQGSLGLLVGDLRHVQIIDLTGNDEAESNDRQSSTIQDATNIQSRLRDSSIELVERNPQLSNHGVSLPQITSNSCQGKIYPKNYIDLTIDESSPGSLLLNSGVVGKRSMDQAQLGQHHPSKRVNVGRSPPNISHQLLSRPQIQPLRSDDKFMGFSDSDGIIEPSLSSASLELLGVWGSSTIFDNNPGSTHYNQGLHVEPTRSSNQPSQQRYTFGDCFCGAGGTSRGALEAGLRIDWGFDFNNPACQSFKLNFPAAEVYNISAQVFVNLVNLDHDHKVDICHLSPPCQFFSPAHTVEGKDDKMNIATLFSVGKLIDKVRPRVVTLEQTDGLLRRHTGYFNALILMFTERGFSIRWRLLRCADYGLPQSRQRLFVIATW